MFSWNFKAMKFFLIAFFVYIFLEGVLRKWIFPNQAGMFFYAVKYVLLGAVYLTYLTLPHSIKAGKILGIKYAVTIYIFLVIVYYSSILLTNSSNFLYSFMYQESGTIAADHKNNNFTLRNNIHSWNSTIQQPKMGIYKSL